MSLALIIFLIGSPVLRCQAQTLVSGDTATPEIREPQPLSKILRLEHVDVPGAGAELLTIHARLDGIPSEDSNNWVPLVSILRDTLGDGQPENDRLRYVWPLTFTRPTLKQRVASAIPFFYTRVGNKDATSVGVPPVAFDLSAPESEVWNKIFWSALQNILLDTYGIPLKASSNTYRHNLNQYRKSHLIRALSVLALYQAVKGEACFTESEMAEIQARLMLSDKMFGGLVDDSNLQTYYSKQSTATKDFRGHNWELLRQRAETEALYFEPLLLPDGSATHALLWISKADLEKPPRDRYSSRFLNIANPWTDKRLLNWKGYVATRYFDVDGNVVPKDHPNAKPVEFVPLALYGLDYPKIPMLLVDFRDGYNPKKREMSRRVLSDVTRNILSVSKFGNLPYFLGRTVFDFVTGRRGIDYNQPTRLQTYSQLKLLLSLSNSLDPELRSEVGKRLEKISLNPLENDFDVEANLAKHQYAALLNYTKNPAGLAAKIERDRRSELTPLEHGSKAQFGFKFLNVLTFGRYVHREELTDDMGHRLDIARRLSYHTKFLEQVARSKSDIDVGWNLEDIKRSLNFLAEHGSEASNGAVEAAGKIFSRTKNDGIRRACLDSLSRISNPKARNEIIRISQNKETDATWKEIAETYLRQRNEPVQPIASSVSGSPIKAGQP
jgi:hypothetical protein